jgi:uncharacterized damage-inducible protein DinB
MYVDLISRGFRRNQRVIAAQADGLSNEDSLRQSGYNTNCFNWVLGHIVAGRDEILELLGGSPVLARPAAERYQRESEPITASGPGVMTLSDLLVALGETEVRIEAALAGADEAFMTAEVSSVAGRTATRADQLMFRYFHDTYHTGQTDVIRQLSGKSDKVI